jgi:YHS domain-containing protein/mono/diheme cytochrome c family protein
LHVPFERTTDRQEPIQHTSQFFLMDRGGHVRGVYGSLDDKAVLRLIADATMLDANTETPAKGDGKPNGARPADPSVSRGLALFQALGCGGCHADPKTGPSLSGLAGQRVRLEGGTMVTADEAYLGQSILDAGDKVVSGYNPLMPSYRDYLTGPEVNDLVAYLLSLVAAEGQAASPPNREGADVEVRDPVCGMKIKRDRAAAHDSYRGKSYYFCSELCRERFVAKRAGMSYATDVHAVVLPR